MPVGGLTPLPNPPTMMSDRRRVNFRESPLSSQASSRYASDSGAGSMSDYPGSSAAGVGSNSSSRYSSSDRTAFAGHDNTVGMSVTQWPNMATLEVAYNATLTSKDQWKLRAQDLDNDVKQLEKELKEEQNRRHEMMDRLKRQSEDDKTQLEEAQEKVHKLEEKGHKLEEENQKLADDNEKLEDENQKLEDENQKLADDNEKAEEESQKLEEDNQKLEDKNRRLEDKNHKLEESVHKLEEKVRKAEEETKKQEETCRKLTREKKALADKIEKLEDEVSSLRQDVANANARCNELQCNVAPPFTPGLSAANSEAAETTASRSPEKKSAGLASSNGGARESRDSRDTRETRESRETREPRDGKRSSSVKAGSNSNGTAKVSRSDSKHDNSAKEQKKRLLKRFESKDGDSNSNASSSSGASSASHRNHIGTSGTSAGLSSSGGATSNGTNNASSGMNGAASSTAVHHSHHHSTRQGSSGSSGSGSGSNGSMSGNVGNEISGTRQPGGRRQSMGCYVEPFGPGAGHIRPVVTMAAPLLPPSNQLKVAPPRSGASPVMPGQGMPMPPMSVMPGPGGLTPFGAYGPMQQPPYYGAPQQSLISPRGDTKMLDGSRPTVVIYDETAVDFPYQGDGFYAPPRPRHPR